MKKAALRDRVAIAETDRSLAEAALDIAHDEYDDLADHVGLVMREMGDALNLIAESLWRLGADCVAAAEARGV